MHSYISNKLDSFCQQLKFGSLTTIPKVLTFFSKFIYATNVKNKQYGRSSVSFPPFQLQEYEYLAWGFSAFDVILYSFFLLSFSNCRSFAISVCDGKQEYLICSWAWRLLLEKTKVMWKRNSQQHAKQNSGQSLEDFCRSLEM